MGANFYSYTIDKALTTLEVEKSVKQKIEEAREMFGSNVYSGQLNTKQGVSVKGSKVFQSENDAYEYVMDNTDKWDNLLLAVPYTNVTEEVIKQPTFNGVAKADVTQDMLICRSSVLSKLKSVVVVDKNPIPADQLSKSKAKMISRAASKALDAIKEYTEAKNQFDFCITQLNNWSEYKEINYAAIKKMRNKLPKLSAKMTESIQALIHRDEEYAKSLYVTEQKNHGNFWFVGCWCPE